MRVSEVVNEVNWYNVYERAQKKTNACIGVRLGR